MIIKSDWHLHSENSYDAMLSLDEISLKTKELGITRFGITDHANFNDKSFLGDLDNSAKSVKEFWEAHPEVVLGVELTPIAKPEFDYIAKTGTREGYVAPITDKPFEIELAQTKKQLISRGVRYAIGAAHWRVDVPNGIAADGDMDTQIKEWYRQQMWLAQDERVTILGHPWYHGKGIWYQDFSVIPRSMNLDIAHALKENGKFVECNQGNIASPVASEKFKKQYAEFLRELFEMGIPVTFGSDSHNSYQTEGVLEANELLKWAGFAEGDISELKEENLW